MKFCHSPYPADDYIEFIHLCSIKIWQKKHSEHQAPFAKPDGWQKSSTAWKYFYSRSRILSSLQKNILWKNWHSVLSLNAPLDSFLHWVNSQIQILTWLLLDFPRQPQMWNIVTIHQGQIFPVSSRTQKTKNPDEWYDDYDYLEPCRIGLSMKVMHNSANRDIVHQEYI